MKKLQLGDKVLIRSKLIRTREELYKYWRKCDLLPKERGIFLGYRTLYNGYFEEEECTAFIRTSPIHVGLVCINSRENPFYVLLEDIEKIS